MKLSYFLGLTVALSFVISVSTLAGNSENQNGSEQCACGADGPLRQGKNIPAIGADIYKPSGHEAKEAEAKDKAKRPTLPGEKQK